MSDILVKPFATVPVLRLEDSSPWAIRFHDVDDLIMPFDGTVVIPGEAGELPDFNTTGMREFMFLPLRHPLSGPDTSKRFPTLRDMNNRVVVTSKPAIIFVADDHSFLGDYHPTNFFSDISNTYDPVFKNNFTICTTAKYFLFEFDAGIFDHINGLPTDLAPFACKKDFHIRTNDSGDAGVTSLRNLFNDRLINHGAFSGTIRSFDISGRETETYSTLLQLGVPQTEIENSPSADNEVKLQFVDIHGEPLQNTAVPLLMINTEPSLASIPDISEPSFYQLNFPGTDRTLKFKLKVPGSIPGIDPINYYFHYFTLWPGYRSSAKEIKSDSEWTSIDLNNEVAGPVPYTFIRICLFNPTGEFQMSVGGDKEEKSYTNLAGELQKRFKFKNNDLYAFTLHNKVNTFLAAGDFFSEYHKLISALKDGDRLYQCNWQSFPLAHLKGSSALRGIARNDSDTATIEAALAKSKAACILMPVKIQSKDMASEEWRTLYLPASIDNTTVFGSDVQVLVETIPGAGEFSDTVLRTIARTSSTYAWLLKPGDPSAIPADASDLKAHRLRVSWKNRAGEVFSTVLNDILGGSTQGMKILPAAIDNSDPDPNLPVVTIGTDNHDPRRLQIRRTRAMNRFGDGSNDACILIINLQAGVISILPLNPPGASTTATDVILTDPEVYAPDSKERKAIELLVTSFSAEDEFIFALCRPTVNGTEFFEDLLISAPWYVRFPHDAFRIADIPLHETELGGVFRKAIAANVKVRALYWENYLATITGGDDLLRGLTNNESLANIINATIDGKHGYAVLDRATRDFGSWHQKCSVIIQKDPDDTIVGPDKKDLLTSYVGGMDLALNRWDTQEHWAYDPDRQGIYWYDVHAKVEGEAGLDVLRNFSHRWKANGKFLESGFEDVRPVNVNAQLTNELTLDFQHPAPGELKMPAGSNAFVQINRTIPPRSCLSLPGVDVATGVMIPEQTGELGSLASYMLAFDQARKFIIINEQYFFSQEIALKLHERLLADDGPEFLILIVPLNLSESRFIDPNLFQARKLAIDTLYYGATVGAPGPNGTLCGRIVPPASGDSKVKDKVAILTPVNSEGDPVYVHAKHMIVDDVWMSIGSANLGTRSLTFDGEINAAILGSELYRGKTNVVSNHRIELCRQLLGLPNSYSALLQDPYATFQLFKAIEKQHETYSFRLHPKPLHTMWLDPLYKVKVGETAFDQEVDLVATVNFNDPSFSYLICNALDPDGRSNRPTRLAFLFSGLVGKTAPSVTINISLNFTAAADAAIRSGITNGNSYKVVVKMIITTESERGPIVAGPFKYADYSLVISTVTNAIVLNEPGETSDINVITFPVSVTDKYKAVIEVRDVTAGEPGTLEHGGEKLYDPATASPVFVRGSVRNDVINIS